MAIANNLLQVQQCHEEVQTDRWIPTLECRGKSRYVVPPQSWERPVPQQMGGGVGRVCKWEKVIVNVYCRYSGCWGSSKEQVRCWSQLSF